MRHHTHWWGVECLGQGASRYVQRGFLLTGQCTSQATKECSAFSGAPDRLRRVPWLQQRDQGNRQAAGHGRAWPAHLLGRRGRHAQGRRLCSLPGACQAGPQVLEAARGRRLRSRLQGSIQADLLVPLAWLPQGWVAQPRAAQHLQGKALISSAAAGYHSTRVPATG